MHAKTCMNLEIIMLGKRCQTQKPHGWFHLYEISRISKYRSAKGSGFLFGVIKYPVIR